MERGGNARCHSSVQRWCGGRQPTLARSRIRSRDHLGPDLGAPSFLYSVDATIVAPKLPGVQWIYAGTKWRWYNVIGVDEIFDVAVTFTAMEEKSGRRFGLWILQTGEIVYRGDDGALVAVAEGRVGRTPRRRRSRPEHHLDGAKESLRPGLDAVEKGDYNPSVVVASRRGKVRAR